MAVDRPRPANNTEAVKEAMKRLDFMKVSSVCKWTEPQLTEPSAGRKIRFHPGQWLLELFLNRCF
jgi:hypothetical protein